ncbi:MAG: DUF429 domain-containing protein [Candidatus Dormibacteraeota bacterium]|nr:DUF429 domain-containing protein [Candidatus Dormibacteraeota bacterium]
MITAGVDVASKAKNTAACWVEWSRGEATVLRCEPCVADSRLRAILGDAGVEKVGVDVPIGWPEGFVDSLGRYHEGGEWGDLETSSLVLRATDHEVHRLTGRRPLSVSTDRIAYPAMRVARLLGGVDRSGLGRVVEVYPAAALRVWGMNATGYKRSEGLDVLGRLLAALRGAAPWLQADQATWGLLRRSDHLFDSLVAAMIARARAVGRCHEIPGEALPLAAREGWIAVPLGGSLDGLADDGQPAA